MTRSRLIIIAAIFMLTACDSGGGTPTPDAAVPQDTVQDFTPGADTTQPDVAADTIPWDAAADTIPWDAATDTIPWDTAADTNPWDAAADTILLDVAMDLPPDLPPDAPPGPEVPLPGFGEITGACGVLTPTELTDGSSYVFVNHLDFGENPYDDEELALLTDGGQEIWNDGNAGGSSIYSEIFAFEVLARCELAGLIKTETEVVYSVPDSKITDLLVEIDDLKIGVSVTRAVGWPRDDPWTTDQAVTLLEKKLQGIESSSAGVAPEDAWTKQILHVIAYTDQHAQVLQDAMVQEITPALAGDTIVIVTVSDGDDGFLY